MNRNLIFQNISIFFLSLAFVTGCGGFSIGNGLDPGGTRELTGGGGNSNPTNEPPPGPTDGAFLVLNTKCMRCHDGTAGPNWGTVISEQEWIVFAYQNNTRIVPGHSNESMIILRMVHGPGDQAMPPSAPFPSLDEFDLVKNWINSLPDAGIISQGNRPSQLPPASGNFGNVLAEASTYTIKLGTRHHVKSVFDGIFGPDIRDVTSNLIGGRVSKFGGPCDLYNSWGESYPNNIKCNEPSTGGTSILVDTDEFNIYGDTLPSSFATREGFRMKTCKLSLLNGRNKAGPHDESLIYSIKVATGTSDLSYLQATPVPTDGQIKSAYQLFFPGRSPASSVMGQLRMVTQTAQTAGLTPVNGDIDLRYDSWRYLLYTLCMVPEWQAE